MSFLTDHSDLLVDYASGALPEGPSLVVAAKLAMDEETCHDYHEVEAVGGALLESVTPTEISDGLLEATLARLDREDSASMPMPRHDAPDQDIVPHPLRQYLPDDLDRLKWTSRTSGLDQFDIRLSSSGHRAALLRIRAGEKMPRHTHRGTEFTLVLAGGYSDEQGHYGPGALAICDGTVDHRPVADAGEDCLCLVVLDAPLKMTGPIGRFVNPFLRF